MIMLFYLQQNQTFFPLLVCRWLSSSLSLLLFFYSFYGSILKIINGKMINMAELMWLIKNCTYFIFLRKSCHNLQMKKKNYFQKWFSLLILLCYLKPIDYLLFFCVGKVYEKWYGIKNDWIKPIDYLPIVLCLWTKKLITLSNFEHMSCKWR